MRKKLMVVLAAAVVGAGVGAMLGYGPLLRYKTEGVLSMEMGPSEYKRFAERAYDASTVRQFAAVSPPPSLDSQGLDHLVRDVTRGEWHKPVPKLSKADAKELPDIVLQMEQDKERKGAVFAYLGVRLIHTASDPVEAATVATWLGSYFKDVAAREAVREQVSRWTAENRQFIDRAAERKLKYEFEIQQAQTRAAALKKIVASYPEAARREGQQVVDVRKDNEKFMSPLAQLVAAESEIIEIREKVQKLDREIEQQAFAKAVVNDARSAIDRARSGSETVLKLSEVIIQFSKLAKTEAEREMLSSMAADVSHISARFLSQAQFVATPSVPDRPERPRPLMLMVLVGLLAGLLGAIVLWREALAKMVWQDGRART